MKRIIIHYCSYGLVSLLCLVLLSFNLKQDMGKAIQAHGDIQTEKNKPPLS